MSEINFTLGADPEFCIISTETGGICAEKFEQRQNFGYDGGGMAFELRPNYSKDPLRLVSNIHQSLIQFVIQYPKLSEHRFKAGSYVSQMHQPLGGHIHFGGVPVSSTVNVCKYCNWLDQFVGSLSLLIEDYSEGLLRRSGGVYGDMCDFRRNKHGFEYRTISSWLTSPYVAAAVLCLSKVVMHEAIKRQCKQCPSFVNSSYFSCMYVKDLYKKFDAIWLMITKMELYPMYKHQIELIRTLVRSRRNWFPKHDMKVAWGLVNGLTMTQPKNPDLALKNIWADVTTI